MKCWCHRRRKSWGRWSGPSSAAWALAGGDLGSRPPTSSKGTSCPGRSRQGGRLPPHRSTSSWHYYSPSSWLLLPPSILFVATSSSTNNASATATTRISTIPPRSSSSPYGYKPATFSEHGSQTIADSYLRWNPSISLAIFWKRTGFAVGFVAGRLGRRRRFARPSPKPSKFLSKSTFYEHFG